MALHWTGVRRRERARTASQPDDRTRPCTRAQRSPRESGDNSNGQCNPNAQYNPNAQCNPNGQYGTNARGERTRTLIIDTLTALALIALSAIITGAYVGSPGLLFAYDTPGPVLLWTILMTAPMAIRRIHPQIAAATFAVMAVLQLIAGPSLIYADFMSLPLLYSVMLRGNPRNTRKFIVTALATGTLASAVIVWAGEATPMLAPYISAEDLAQYPELNQLTTTLAYNSCRLVYAQGEVSADCLRLVTQEALAVWAAITACIVSIIIIAFWQRAKLATVRMMRERNAALEASEQEEKRIAALAERARIARDMHDVVAHTLSIIIVQSDGGQYAGADDPVIARRTMETIRRESERALHDMRRLLGVFGGSRHADYADVDALVSQARAAANHGCTIERVIEGTAAPTRLSGPASVAVYRLVQEALTNIRKYAGPGAHATIRERWDADALTVTVTDDGRGAAAGLDGHKAGYGLIGLRERIAAVGGSADAGPRLGGGFVVHAVVPLGEAAAAGAVAAGAASAGAATAHDESDAIMQPNRAVSNQAVGNRAAASNIGSTIDNHAINTTINSRDAESTAVKSANCASDGNATAASPTPTQPMPTQRTAQPTPAPPSRRTSPWLSIIASMRSKPIAQAGGGEGMRLNYVERLSQWCERHYLLTDTIIALLLAVLFAGLGSTFSLYFAGWGTDDDLAVQHRIIAFMMILPLALRRRFPETTAAMISVLAMLQLIALQPIAISDLLAPVALYSAVLYGRPAAWKWTGTASMGVSVLFGGKVAVSSLGYGSILRWITGTPDTPFPLPYSMRSVAFNAISWTIALALICVGTIMLARWHRSRGANVLVLQAREDALRLEQSKQRTLAANMERDRISGRIQTEVTATLTRVIDQADQGIARLDEAEASGVRPSAEEIASSFEAIGDQGRDALAHMRQLLGMLRETGFSDEAHGGADGHGGGVGGGAGGGGSSGISGSKRGGVSYQGSGSGGGNSNSSVGTDADGDIAVDRSRRAGMRLRPAAPLDVQLRNAARRHRMDGTDDADDAKTTSYADADADADADVSAAADAATNAATSTTGAAGDASVG